MGREYYLLKGQDQMMNTTLEQRISNTISSFIKVDGENTHEFLYSTIVKRVTRILQNKRHYLRVRQNLSNLDQYYYTQESCGRLAKKIVVRSSKHLTHLGAG